MKQEVSNTLHQMAKNGSKTKPGSKSRSQARTQSKTKKSDKLTDFEIALMDKTKSGGVGDSNNLTVDDIFRLLDLYFYRDFYAYRHLHNSYNKFINETIPDFLMSNDHVFTEAITEQRVIRHKFEFTNVRADTPKMANEVDPLFPADARKLMQTYQMNIYADVTQFREVVDINATGEQKLQREKVGVTEEGMIVMTVPTMLRSQYCNLHAHPEEVTEECRYDPGGYFIINGSEKIIISQDKMIPNHPMVILKKGSNTAFHMVQVNSTSDELSNMMQTVSIRIKKDGGMVMKFPILYEVNPMIVFRALGIETDADIAEICVYDKTDYHMIDMVRTSLDNCYNDNREGSKVKIRTQDEAIDYLITKMKVVRRYTETNQAIKHEQKKLHLMELLKTSLLPHIKGTSDSPYREKALYMGYMINKLLRVELGRDEVDNRDSYCNKRVANINELLTEIMVQQYKSNMSECNKKFMDWMKDKLATEDPHNVIHHFKASVFEQGFKSALMQGNWPRAKGVSQMLNRISYLQLLSFLSRIDSQSTSKSSSKLTKPRLTDPSSVPFLCLTGDSEVLCGDNASAVQIKDMKNGDSVMSVYQDDLREIRSDITNFFTEMPDRIVKFTTITGRSLKCTPDHPILIRRGETYEMCHAGDLQMGDCVIVRHYNKYLPIDKDVTIVIKDKDIPNEDYLRKLKIKKLVNEPIDQKKLEITARLVGASVSDGHVSKKAKTQYVAEFYLGEEADVYELIDDIKKLGFGSCAIKRRTTKHVNKKNGIHTYHKTWRVSKGGAFAFYLKHMGAFVGDKTLQKKSLPDWIKNGNASIKREFLSGFNGGGGGRMAMQTNQKYDKLHMGGTFQTCHTDHLKETVAYMNIIKKLYEEFGIIGSVRTTKAPDSEDKMKVGYYPSNSYDNVGIFADMIGYRYCNEKRRASAPVIEYVKYKNTLAQTKKDKYAEIVKLEEEGISYGKFIENYYIGKLNLAIPIISIEDIDSEPVYDFTTRMDTHTLIANGIICHNCPVQTPEHAKVGLIKHLSMIGSLTIGDKDNTEIVREFIMTYPDVEKITTVKIHDLKKMFKIFLNGEWIGMIRNQYEVGNSFMDNPSLKFFSIAKQKKIRGEFDSQMTSVVLDSDDGEIRFNTDSGRLYRPVLRVTGDNELVLTKEMIDRISLKPENTDKITVWDNFYTMEEYPIEFIDSEEQPYYMFAPMIKDLNEEREKILKSKDYKFTGREDKVVNRYSDKFFVRYDYCEIHPSVLLGEVATNIPFPNRNQGPRNIFQYAQGRQGMGIYNTVYRSRTDISYVLYHPETPIVNTRTSKYTYTDVLGPGSNAIVAIATYGGYNQEDSLVFNMTSLQRGLFRSMSLKKYMSQITKNQETSANDKFMKPAPDKTLGMKHGNYEKLNMEGYVPEETSITNGDIIFGKVTPITDMPDSDKIYKDESEMFKSHSDGVIDRVYTGIHNQEGQEVRRALVRMERIPMIGDKFCVPDNVEMDVLTDHGWKPLRDVTLEDQIATLDNGVLSYEYPIDVHAFDYDGDIYELRSQQVDLDVTVDHELYVKKHDHDEFELVRADEIMGKRYRLKKNCDNSYDDSAQIEINGTQYDYDTYLDLLGIFIADGCLEKNTSNDYRIMISCGKERKIEHLETVARKLGVHITSQKNPDTTLNDRGLDTKHYINSKDIYSKFESLNKGALNKELPFEVWRLSQRQARILINSLISCDSSHNNQESVCYYTSSKKLADDVMRLAIHAGWAGSIKMTEGSEYTICERNETSNDDAFSVRIIKSKCEPQINHGNSKEQDGQSERTYHYAGKVRCIEVPSHVFMVRQNGKNVWIGNCTRHGQKGTKGIGYNASDMPYTKNGIRPDVIMNPNAVPSRMTIGQFWEQLMGKVGALLGINMDATAFEDYDINAVEKLLTDQGYDGTGEEYLFNGMTGQRMKTSIFIAPAFYQRLKHMVLDKLHARPRGSMTILVRQAAEGRSRDGGLRLGEMERDALIAHGMAKFMLDKMLYNSDVYSTHVCGICGLFAVREVTRNSENKPQSEDIYKCPTCKNYHDIHKIMIPYAFKLMIQEMMAMNILARIRVKKTDRKIIKPITQ